MWDPARSLSTPIRRRGVADRSKTIWFLLRSTDKRKRSGVSPGDPWRYG
ncbi:hypothetical protein RHOER0001_2655 [Rhodococcus erythropolis SK121]|nr:hypothetical protein RHOER0001_2655 [Rhodococcus erythropolis SK121]